MRIKFGDLAIGDIAKDRIKTAMERNWVTEGANVREFEGKFARLFAYKHAIATSSGTDACIACVASLYEFGARRGDEVIVPATTFVSTANAVLAAGLIPRFVDIELETLNINPKMIEEEITDKTRAIMPVHLMGKPCEMDTILKVANKHGLKVIEDACEAHGAQYKGKYVGTIGDMGAFSFYPAHTIVSGEGGMVVTNDDKIADLVRSIKTHGRPTGSVYFDFQRFGLNLRMNDLTAAIGIEGIEHFNETFGKRKNNLHKLLHLTEDLSNYCYFIEEEEYVRVSPHAFPLVLKDRKYDRNKLYGYLESRGIECKTLFGSLPTQHKAFEFLGHKLGDFPVAERVGENGLHFGVYQGMGDDDLVYVSDALKEYFAQFDRNK